jgi:tetratricopeptide (TPR) repeat protein
MSPESSKPTQLLYDQLLKLAHIIRVWLLLPQQALPFYEQALALCQSPQGGNGLDIRHEAQAWFFLGLASRALKRPSDAVRAYQNAIELQPLYSDCYFNLGNIYFEGDLGPSDLYQAETYHR